MPWCVTKRMRKYTVTWHVIGHLRKDTRAVTWYVTKRMRTYTVTWHVTRHMGKDTLSHGMAFNTHENTLCDVPWGFDHALVACGLTQILVEGSGRRWRAASIPDHDSW